MTARALCLLALVGCGPSLHLLVRDHHYREAICGADDGSSGDRDAVLDALGAAADPAIHAYVLQRADLEPLLGDATEAVSARGRLVRISAQTNILPVDGLGLEITIRDGTRAAGSVASWDSLARITGEHLPPRHAERTYWTAGNVLKGFAALFTFGATLPFTEFTEGVRMVDAPDAEYRTVAPRAHALFHAATRLGDGCKNTSASPEATGARCAWVFVIAPEATQLALSVRYRADRVTRSGDAADETCSITKTTTVEIGNVDNLRRMFGTGLRPIRELVP